MFLLSLFPSVELVASLPCDQGSLGLAVSVTEAFAAIKDRLFFLFFVFLPEGGT